MRYSLENPNLTAEIDSLGAELRSIRTKDGHEYLWQGDSASWWGTSPVLFPFIGGVPDNRYRFDGHEYEMQPHGFARKKEWRLQSQSADQLTMKLAADGETLRTYPFEFNFKLHYQISGPSVSVEYRITNSGEGPMPFSVGGHPGFNCPLEAGLDYTDYLLRFSQNENAVRYFKANGLLTGETEPFDLNDGILPLNHALFQRDALILRGIASDEVRLESERGKRSVTVNFSGFPDLGIWSYPASPAPFVCIEPWYGVDSTAGDSGNLREKYGIVWLEPGREFVARFSITVR